MHAGCRVATLFRQVSRRACLLIVSEFVKTFCERLEDVLQDHNCTTQTKFVIHRLSTRIPFISKMMSALVRHKTAIYSGLAVVGAYAAYKAIRPATNTPELQRNRLVTTAKVVKEHVVAATDDVKKEIGEIGSVMRQHSKLAKEDVATAGPHHDPFHVP